MVNKNKQVMRRAWMIARQGQKKFGGKVSEYLPKAMKMAWTIVKNLKEDTQEIIDKKMLQYRSFIYEKLTGQGIRVNVNVWSKYGKNRLYINDNFIEINGYHEIVKIEENAKNEKERVAFYQLVNMFGGVA